MPVSAANRAWCRAAEPAPPRLAADSEGRRKLQTALDDLIACRGLIEAALAGTLSSDNPGDDAS